MHIEYKYKHKHFLHSILQLLPLHVIGQFVGILELQENGLRHAEKGWKWYCLQVWIAASREHWVVSIPSFVSCLSFSGSRLCLSAPPFQMSYDFCCNSLMLSSPHLLYSRTWTQYQQHVSNRQAVFIFPRSPTGHSKVCTTVYSRGSSDNLASSRGVGVGCLVFWQTRECLSSLQHQDLL